MEILSYLNGFDLSMFVDIVLNVLFGVLCVKICNSHSFLLNIDYFRNMSPLEIEGHAVSFWAGMIGLFSEIDQMKVCFDKAHKAHEAEEANNQAKKAKKESKPRKERQKTEVKSDKPMPDNVVELVT